MSIYLASDNGTVRDDPPAPDDPGLVVRPIGPVGPVTFAAPTLGIVTSIPAADIAAVYLAANPARLGATISNDSSDRFLYVKLAVGASSASYTVRIGPHGYFELPFPAYVGVIEGVFTAGAGGFATVTELT